jgi:hypothetical protein
VPAACADVSFAPLKNYRFETPAGGRVVVEPAEIVTGIVSTRVATLIRVRCEGASSSSDEAMLYVDTPDGVALAGYVVGPNESVDGVSFDGGVLRLQGFTNSPEAPRCCPDIVTESAWVLQGDVVQNLSYQARATVEVDGTDPSTCTLLGEVRANVALVGREIVDLQGGSVQGIPTYNKAATLQNLSAISALRSNHTTLGQIQRQLSPSC